MRREQDANCSTYTERHSNLDFESPKGGHVPPRSSQRFATLGGFLSSALTKERHLPMDVNSRRDVAVTRVAAV